MCVFFDSIERSLREPKDSPVSRVPVMVIPLPPRGSLREGVSVVDPLRSKLHVGWMAKVFLALDVRQCPFRLKCKSSWIELSR